MTDYFRKPNIPVDLAAQKCIALIESTRQLRRAEFLCLQYGDQEGVEASQAT